MSAVPGPRARRSESRTACGPCGVSCDIEASRMSTAAPPSAAAAQRRLLLALAATPLVLFFGWLMAQRLERCPKGIQADFVQEWTSARNYWIGRPVYWPLAESLRAYFGQGATTSLLVNAHPPTAVVVALPLGLLDYRTAWTLWNVASLVLLALSAGLVMRALGYRPLDAVPLAALLLASNPLAQQLIE